MILLGEIHWFDPIKGYGFIRTKKGKDIFVHYSAIKGTGFRTLIDGENVCYQIVRNPQGLVAKDVTRLHSPAPRPRMHYH